MAIDETALEQIDRRIETLVSLIHERYQDGHTDWVHSSNLPELHAAIGRRFLILGEVSVLEDAATLPMYQEE